MPLVKIEIKEGKSIEQLIQIKEIVMDTVVEVLQLNNNDRNIRIQEFKPGLFEMKSPYEMLIEIILFKGRTKQTKKNLFRKIVENLESKAQIDKEKVFIVLNEQPLENWGVRGGIPADEIQFDFKVNI